VMPSHDVRSFHGPNRSDCHFNFYGPCKILPSELRDQGLHEAFHRTLIFDDGSACAQIWYVQIASRSVAREALSIFSS
jgi:hypothetical protein